MVKGKERLSGSKSGNTNKWGKNRCSRGNVKNREIVVHCVEVETRKGRVSEGIGQLHVYKDALRRPKLGEIPPSLGTTW